MYKISVTSNVDTPHAIFAEKLNQYGFQLIRKNEYLSLHTVDDLMGVMFYKSNLEGKGSPYTVTAHRTKRVV